jgi:2-polyprenyl-3-methyl-5-hydroxy-6-metoxy-1,4-benzoquinol methylase
MDYFFRASSDLYDVYQCTNPRCGAASISPKPNSAQLERAYSQYYTHEGAAEHLSQKSSARTWRRLFRKCLEREIFVERWASMFLAEIAPTSLLDVGCGQGLIARQMMDRGWAVLGQEVDAVAAARAMETGVDVHIGPIESIEGKLFGAITMSHVIEHVSDPLQTLNKCKQLLAPGGRLVLITPNIKSLGKLFFGRYWRGYEIPRHLHVFSSQALARLVMRAGFSIVESHTSAMNAQSTARESFGAWSGIEPDAQPGYLRAAVLAFAVIEGLLNRASKTVGEELILIAKLN